MIEIEKKILKLLSFPILNWAKFFHFPGISFPEISPKTQSIKSSDIESLVIESCEKTGRQQQQQLGLCEEVFEYLQR